MSDKPIDRVSSSPKPAGCGDSIPRIFLRRSVLDAASESVGYEVSAAELTDAYQCWARVSDSALSLYIDHAFERAIALPGTNPKDPAGGTVLGRITSAQIIRAARGVVRKLKAEDAARRSAKRLEKQRRRAAQDEASRAFGNGDLVVILHRVLGHVVERADDGDYIVMASHNKKQYKFAADRIARPLPADTPNTDDQG